MSKRQASNLEGAVQAGRCVASKDSHEGEQQDGGCEQAPSIGWGQEAQHSKNHGDESHGQQLEASPSVGRQEGRELGRPEDISVYLNRTSLLSRTGLALIWKGAYAVDLVSVTSGQLLQQPLDVAK